MMNIKAYIKDETNKSQLALSLIVLLSSVILLLLIAIYLLDVMRPAQQFFTLNQATQRLRAITALDEPNVSTAALLRWASLAVTTAYTMDFVNYENNLETSKNFFTEKGFLNFKAALDASNRLNDIISQKLIVSAVAESAPTLMGEGIKNNVYTWRVKVPILLTYQGASEKSSRQRTKVIVTIKRVSTKEAQNGIGIEEIQDINSENMI
jgi:intracellular multiplication protein IcmL